jgi:lysophospholipase L1-like esterase
MLMRHSVLIVGSAVVALLTGCQSTPVAMDPTIVPVGSRGSDSNRPARHLDESADWVQRRYRAIERDLASGADLASMPVLFVGDSITQHYAGDDDPAQASAWRAAHATAGSPHRALNLGVAGDRTENLLHRLLPKAAGGMGHLDDPRIQPQVIVLMIGINNTWSTRNDIVELTVRGQLEVIRRLKALRPNATLVVNALLPTNHRAHDRDLVEPINRRLAMEVGRMGPDVHWLDVYPAFLRADGTGDPGLFKDGVHPNPAGYARWSSVLLPRLDALRAARAASSRTP